MLSSAGGRRGTQAFVSRGMKWASYIVALGALLGITTGTMIGLLAVARSICALGREHFIWPIFGWVRPQFLGPAAPQSSPLPSPARPHCVCAPAGVHPFPVYAGSCRLLSMPVVYPGDLCRHVRLCRQSMPTVYAGGLSMPPPVCALQLPIMLAAIFLPHSAF